MKKLIKIVIDRRKWLRGIDDGVLRNNEGKMCCLGFAVRQVGHVSAKSITGKAMPEDVNKLVPGLNHKTAYNDFDNSSS